MRKIILFFDHHNFKGIFIGVAQKELLMTDEEYLSIERQATEKSEFYQGECFAMAGASRWHNLLTGRMFAALLNHLEESECTPYMADMRLHVKAHRHYVYPDVVVVCQEQAYVDDDMIDDATVIIEVLSATTELYDRGRKFLHYQSLPSFQEYVLISQNTMQVEIFSRGEMNKWEYERLTQATKSLFLKTLQFSITLAELYKSVPLNQE